MPRIYNRSVNGFYPAQIRNVIELIYDVKPSHYDWVEEEKTFIFFIKRKALEGEKRQAWKKKIEKKIGIRIQGI